MRGSWGDAPDALPRAEFGWGFGPGGCFVGMEVLGLHVRLHVLPWRWTVSNAGVGLFADALAALRRNSEPDVWRTCSLGGGSVEGRPERIFRPFTGSGCHIRITEAVIYLTYEMVVHFLRTGSGPGCFGQSEFGVAFRAAGSLALAVCDHQHLEPGHRQRGALCSGRTEAPGGILHRHRNSFASGARRPGASLVRAQVVGPSGRWDDAFAPGAHQ